MSRSHLGCCWISQSAAPLPLGFGDLLAVNILIQATSLGYLAALFRRDWFAPIHGMVSRLAYPVVTGGLRCWCWVPLLPGVSRSSMSARMGPAWTAWLQRVLRSGWVTFCAHLDSYCLHFISFAFNTRLFDFTERALGYLPAYRRVASWVAGAWSSGRLQSSLSP